MAALGQIALNALPLTTFIIKLLTSAEINKFCVI